MTTDGDRGALFETAVVGQHQPDGGGLVVQAKPVPVSRTEDCESSQA